MLFQAFTTWNFEGYSLKMRTPNQSTTQVQSKYFQQNCWSSVKCVQFIDAPDSWWASHMNDCIGEVGALLRSDGRPGCIVTSGLSSSSWHHWPRSGGQSGTVTPRSSNLLLVPLAAWPDIKCRWKSQLAFFKAVSRKTHKVLYIFLLDGVLSLNHQPLWKLLV